MSGFYVGYRGIIGDKWRNLTNPLRAYSITVTYLFYDKTNMASNNKRPRFGGVRPFVL